MIDYDNSRPLISIHVPKCAGSSSYQVLRKWYGRKLLRHYYDEKRNRMPKRHKLTTGLFRKRSREGICIHCQFAGDRVPPVLTIGYHLYPGDRVPPVPG